MNYETINMGSYNLHLIKSKKFKTITIDVDFYRQIKKEEITKRNLLKMVLLDSTKNYQNEKELIIESENLYDIKVSSSISRIGNFSNLSFQTRFLNDKYTEKNMNEESIIFFLDLIFNPNIIDKKFKNIDIQKNKLKQQIISLKDNKIRYSIIKTLETFKNMPYSYNTFGYLEDIDNINSSNLYEYYLNVLKEDQVDIFVLGDFDSNDIKRIFKDNFKVDTFKKNNKNIITKELNIRKRIARYHEYDDVNQAQLILVCSLNNLTDYERKYVIKLYNEILGGSSNSILFDNVREKSGYCYYINSSVKAYDNILLINSGVEFKNIDKCIKLIKKCFKQVQNGKISDDIITSCKKTIVSGINTALDEPLGIINTCFSKELVKSDDTPDRIKKFSNISKEDIIKVSKKVHLHTVLTLENGGKNGKN